jgi:hypothetical protein
MNLDELMDALSGADPDPRTVLDSLGRKQRRSRQRMLTAASGACVAVLAVLGGLYLSGHTTGDATAAASGSAAAPAPAVSAPVAGRASTAAGAFARPSSQVPQRTSAIGPRAAAGSGAAGSCAASPLQDAIAAAVRSGASVIVATGTLTGKSVTASTATAGAPAFYAMTLSSVQTLRGPAIAPGSVAWIPGPAPGAAASPENSMLLAAGGRLFAIVTPQPASRAPAGPTLRLAPVVGASVVFTPYGCWDVSGLRPSQYQGKAALRPVPAGPDVSGLSRPAESGLYAVPLATVEQVAATA